MSNISQNYLSKEKNLTFQEHAQKLHFFFFMLSHKMKFITQLWSTVLSIKVDQNIASDKKSVTIFPWPPRLFLSYMTKF